MEENQQKIGTGKLVVTFLLLLGVSLGYYLFLDWSLMVHAQNLPFPYK